MKTQQRTQQRTQFNSGMHSTGGNMTYQNWLQKPAETKKQALKAKIAHLTDRKVDLQLEIAHTEALLQEAIHELHRGIQE